MRETAEADPALLGDMAAFEHPRADAVPTGAIVASAEDIREIRESVTEALAPWLTGNPVGRDASVKFDTVLGRALHESLAILPADAAHDETWAFLSAVVFPDVVWARFPDLHEDRVLGKRHRNTLRRAWFRYDVIGDLQWGAAAPLGEDEMTGLFERSQVSRDRNLVRTVARMILDSVESNRSKYARELMKSVTALTGTFLLDGLDERQLQDRIASLTGGGPPPATPPAVDELDQRNEVTVDQRDHVPESDAIPDGSTVPDTRDLVRTFHQAMLDLCGSIYRELRHDPTVLIRMISELGGLEAARSIVGSAHPSETFTKLLLRGRQDLSVEALILEERFRGLFSPALLDRAEQRLGRS